MQEMQFQYLSREDHLEEGMGTHSSILAWEIPWTEEPGELQYRGSFSCHVHGFSALALLTAFIDTTFFLPIFLVLFWTLASPAPPYSF